MSCVICQVSCIMCPESYVTCHMSLMPTATATANRPSRSQLPHCCWSWPRSLKFNPQEHKKNKQCIIMIFLAPKGKSYTFKPIFLFVHTNSVVRPCKFCLTPIQIFCVRPGQLHRATIKWVAKTKKKFCVAIFDPVGRFSKNKPAALAAGQTLPDATSAVGKLHPFSKITITWYFN